MNDVEVRRFLRCSTRHLDDATYLADGGRHSGAVYLAGYAAECALKALALSVTPLSQRAGLLESFRGNRGHDFNYLRFRCTAAGSVSVPKSVAEAISVFRDWSTDLRYDAGALSKAVSARFVEAAGEVLRWATSKL